MGNYRNKVAAALQAFLTTDSWAETHQIFEEKQDLLLSDIALHLLRQFIHEQREAGNYEFVETLEMHLHLLEDARTFGVASAWQRFEQQQIGAIANNFLMMWQDDEDEDGEDHPFERMVRQIADDSDGASEMLGSELAEQFKMVSLIMAFVQADSWDETFDILTQHQQVLLSDDTLELLHFFIAREHKEGNHQQAENLEKHLQLLEHARKYGIEATQRRRSRSSSPQRHGTLSNTAELLDRLTNHIEPLEDLEKALHIVDRTQNPIVWAAIIRNRGYHYIMKPTERSSENIEQALADFNVALKIFTREGEDFQRAQTFFVRGLCYAQRIYGDAADNLEQAIGDYNSALEVFTRERWPEKWAEVLFNRAAAHAKRVRGNPANNIEQVIVDSNNALQVWTREVDAFHWAQLLHNRGGAYLTRIRGDRRENIEQAIADFNIALTILTREDHPFEWASTLSSRAAAYGERIEGNPSVNAERAIADFSATLEVYTREFHPFGWAKTHLNRANVYMDRILGTPAKNVEQAIADLDTALEVFSREETPLEWAMAHSNRALAYQRRILGDKATSVEEAIADLNDALTVYTYEFSPIEWAKTVHNRGGAYVRRLLGNASENIEKAIADFDAALAVFTPENTPAEWTATHAARAMALRERIQGNKIENIERSIANLTAASELFTPESNPIEWARMRNRRGSAYLERFEGDRSENIEQAIADFNAALEVFTQQDTPREWASALVDRSAAYRLRLRGNQVENIEQALADCNATLQVLTYETLPYDWAEALYHRGSAYLKRIRGNREENIERAIADFNDALRVRTREALPEAWASAINSRGTCYIERSFGDRAENLHKAIADLDAALEVWKREEILYDWATAHTNRGIAYLQAARETEIVENERVSYLEQALIDFDAALEVFTADALPSDYLDAQINRSLVLEELGRWEETHAALQIARQTTQTLMEMAITDIGRTEVLDQTADADIYLRDAQALLRCEPPHTSEALIALEEGRAQNLRARLELDRINPEAIENPAARRRAEAFVATHHAWLEAQREFSVALPGQLSPREREAEIARRREYLHATHIAFIKARDAIREQDSPELLAHVPSFENIARAVIEENAALVYLAAAEKGGWALIVTQNTAGTPSVQYLPLPELTFETVSYKLLWEHGTQIKATPYGPLSHKLPVGGLTAGQMGWAFDFIKAWGGNLHTAGQALPAGCGLQRVARNLVSRWLDEGLDSDMLMLSLMPFFMLSHEDSQQLAMIINSALLNMELERSLKALGELGLNELAQALLAAGIHKVTLIPCGRLASFPFPAVTVRLANGSERRLGDIFEVTIAPSARAAEIAHQRAADLDRIARPAILAVGNPQPLPYNVGNLPYAEAEAGSIQRIAKAFESSTDIRCLRSRAATREHVVAALEHAWYAHLAVHGQYDTEEPRRSRLILAGNETIREEDRSIYLSEVLDGAVNLRGLRLLILSACETAITDVLNVPDESLGLAAGFLQAGAAGVIASLWAVDDFATYLLMSRFAQLYLDQQRNWSPARALAEAQRWLREEATNTALMTYDPTCPVPITHEPSLRETQSENTQLLSTTNPEQTASGWRSLRFTHTVALNQIHLQAAQRALNEPDALPYSDPIYWAGFAVTGC